MDQDVKSDWDWSDQYIDQAKGILLLNISGMVDIKTASVDKDLSQSTDIVFTFKDGDIAVRIRRDDCTYRDLTIRYSRSSGVETEASKIKRGFARWYLYGWTNNTKLISEWMIVDLDKVRKHNLLDNRSPKPNTDGKTQFIYVGYKELLRYDCLIAYKINGQAKTALPLIVQEQIDELGQEVKRLKKIVKDHERRKKELAQAVRGELEDEMKQLRQQIQYLVAMMGQAFSPVDGQGAFLNISGISPVLNNGDKGNKDNA